MIYALVRKEFRQLLPLTILVVILFNSNLIFYPISGRVDEGTWSDISGYLEPGSQVESSVVLMILCFMTAFSLFPREHDEKTIEYLYSLPVSRTSVFLSKFIAALSILCIALFTGTFSDWIIHLFNRQPFSGDQFDLKNAVTGCFLMTAFIFTMLSYGVFLSFFRRFGLVIFGLCWVIVSTLKKVYPFLEHANIFNLVTMEYHGQTLLIPWKPVSLNTGMGIACLFMAGFLWGTPADRFSTWYNRLSKRRIGTVIGAGSLIAVTVLFLIIYVRLIKEDAGNVSPPVAYVSFQTATFSTDHYRFTYPQSLRETAHRLIGEADGVYEKTRDFLSAENGRPIVVDLTEESHEHAGIAALHKIRMDIRRDDRSEERLRILAHETSHIFSILESNKKIIDHNSSTVFYNEGLAEFLSYSLFPDEEKLEAQRLLAATAWKRHGVTFDMLADRASFRKHYNEHLFYVIGELWVKAFYDTYGKGAVSDVLRAMGRKDAPTDLRGAALWQDTLQAMDCELEKINGEWLKQLADLSKEYESEIEGLPRIRGGVLEKNRKEVTLTATLDRIAAPDSFTFLVRYRNDPDDSEEDTHAAYGEIQFDKSPLEIIFKIPAHRLTGRNFEYQFGYLFNWKAYPYFEEWQSGQSS